MSSELIPDFSVSRQLTPQGPLLFWKDDVGLACQVRFCTEKNCLCREAIIDVVVVDRDLVALSIDAHGLHVSLRNNDKREAGSVVLNMDSGEVIADRTTLPAELVAILTSHCDGELLNLLHARWLENKGIQVDPHLWKSLDFSYATPDTTLCYDQLFPGGRDDIYTLDGRSILAADAHCIKPDCACQHVHVSFLALAPHGAGPEEDEDLGEVHLDLQNPKNADLFGTPEHATLLQKLWQAYTARHAIQSYLPPRHAAVRAIVPDFWTP